jgi:predicted PurR-regulated permease PerM
VNDPAPTHPRPELARPVLAVLSILTLMVASLWILRPFIGAFVWATTIVVATWPVLLSLERILGGRRKMAVLILSLILLGVLFVPFVLSVGTLVDNVDLIVARAQSLSDFHVPPLPERIANLPLIGPKLATAWDRVVGAGIEELLQLGAPYAGKAANWVLFSLGGIGIAFLQFLLTVLICAILWKNGESAATSARRYARRLAGDRGENSLRLAGQAIRGVAMGVVVTALAQSLLGGLGLLIAGVPLVPLLTAVMLMLCIAQIGPFPVLLSATAWVFYTGRTGWGTFLLIWSLVVGPLDNFLRPVLIRKGADLPLLLVFAGVIGGLIWLGLIGVFVGPVILAVTHTLVENWASEEPLSESGTGGGRPGRAGF